MTLSFYAVQSMLVFPVPELFFLEFNPLGFRFVGRHAVRLACSFKYAPGTLLNE